MTTLSLRALNRALLDRQWLLDRRDTSALAAIEHLVGMQSQAPLAPYTGLWTRLSNFTPDDLIQLMENRHAVRLPLMRSTIHLVTATDALGIHPLLRDVQQRSLYSNQTLEPLRATIDLEALAAAGVRLLTESPLNGKALGAALSLEFPGYPPAVLSRAVRDLLAGVQVPPRGIWGKGGQPITTTLESWLATDPTPYTIDTLVLRYLAAYGPASPLDTQQWCGLTHLTEVFARLRPQLRVYTLEGTTRELFDLPTIDLPDPDTPAPLRFIPEFDNLYLSHADRTRILPDTHRPHIFTNNGIIKATILHDGLPIATWKPTLTKTHAHLTITPITPIPTSLHPTLHTEAQTLLTHLSPNTTQEIEFAPSP